MILRAGPSAPFGSIWFHAWGEIIVLYGGHIMKWTPEGLIYVYKRNPVLPELINLCLSCSVYVYSVENLGVCISSASPAASLDGSLFL